MKLGEVINVKHGFAFSGEHIIEEDNGIVLVTPGNFQIGGGFQEKKCKYFDGNIPSDFILHEGDFIVTMTDLSKTIDTLGYSAIVPSSSRLYLHNQRIGLVELKNDLCDKGFIYWLMRTHDYQRSIANTSTGSTVHHTSPSKIYEYEFDAPSISMQRRIAEILFRYEYLITNLQKQIKLLEEKLKLIYQKWFIELHFPGCESTTITDGVPFGWQKTTLDNICCLSKQAIPIIDIPKDKPYIGLEHIPRRDFCLSDWGSTSEINSSKYKYQENDIIFGKIRPYLHKVGFAINSGYATTDSFIMRPKLGLWGTLLMTTSSDSFVNYTSQTCKEGAKMPRADWNEMKQYPVLIATDIIQQQFETNCQYVAQCIKRMAKQVRLLMEARDRLLPKLMSGEIQV